jgi:hypothetical protein
MKEFEKKYVMPKALNEVKTFDDIAANIGLFLTVNGMKTYEEIGKRIKASDQRKLFGVNLGRGLIWVDGRSEVVEHIKKIAFGQDIHMNRVINAKLQTIYFENGPDLDRTNFTLDEILGL